MTEEQAAKADNEAAEAEQNKAKKDAKIKEDKAKKAEA